MSLSVSDLPSFPGLEIFHASAGGGATEQVYNNLRVRILTLELAPDRTLMRADLAAEYQVSQTPIREALQLLRRDGLVRIYPQSRTVVTRIDLAEIRAAHFLRVALETEVARRLARGCPPEVLTRGRAILRMQETLVGDPGELGTFQELDALFHRTLYMAVGQDPLHRLVRERSGHLDRFRRLAMPDRRKAESIVLGHEAILAAIALGDPAAAEAATRAHLSGTLARLEELGAAFPEYFT